jgi:GAG-pre-integrase domain
MHKLVEEQDEAVDKVLGKHHKFMEFANNSSPVQNAVALSSTLPEKPVEPSLQDSLPPAPAFKTMKKYDEHEKKHCNRIRKAKKAKKDIHSAPSEMEMTQNVRVFPEVSPNLISESGEPLFLEENLKVFPNSPSIINPKHPRAPYFRALIESLNLDDDEGYLNDPSLDMNHHTDKLSQVEYEEPLDWGIPSAQDDQSSDEDSISNELAATAGLSRLSLTPAPARRLSHAPSRRSSKSKGKQREERHFGGDDQDNNPDSHAYDDHGYNRLVSTNFTVCTLTKDEKLQLLSSLSSLESRVELICNKCSSNLSKCVKCKTRKTQDKIEIMADSGASNCFMHTQSDLTEFEVLDDNDLVVKTASKTNSLKIKRRGAWIITHEVTHKEKKQSITSRFYPVYYLPGLTHQLMSVGHLLNDGLELKGSSSSLEFSRGTSSTKQLLLQFKPYFPGQNIYWLTTRLTSRHAMLAMSSVTTVDYDIMHRRFAHPSKDVLQHASENTQNFPSNMSFPSNDPVCQGCAEGKMTRSSFPPSPGCSKAPFDKIHMDLKEFSIQSYNKYKFFILFFDNCTSFGWIVLLRRKSEADPAIRQFIAMVKNQFNKVIHEFITMDPTSDE